MKKVFSACAFIFLFSNLQAKHNNGVFEKELKNFVTILQAGNKKFLITANEIFLLGKNKTALKTSFSFTCNDACEYENKIALATGNGIVVYDDLKNTATGFMPQKITGRITHIQKDINGRLWFTKEFEGCFMTNGTEVFQKIKVPATYSLVAAGDSNIWAGTNVGLYKIPASGAAITKFAEEGIEGNDIPDNLVERLFADSKSNVWAIMPEHISFIAHSNENSEFPDYGYLGTKENELYHIAELPDKKKQSYLFATKQGILYIPAITTSALVHIGEIHQTVTEKAFLMAGSNIQKPEQWKNEPVTYITTIGSQTYFVTVKGVWSISNAKLLRNIKESFGGR